MNHRAEKKNSFYLSRFFHCVTFVLFPLSEHISGGMSNDYLAEHRVDEVISICAREQDTLRFTFAAPLLARSCSSPKWLDEGYDLHGMFLRQDRIYKTIRLHQSATVRSAQAT